MMVCKTFKSYRELDITRTYNILNLEILQDVTMNIFSTNKTKKKKSHIGIRGWQKRYLELGRKSEFLNNPSILNNKTSPISIT